VHLTLTAGSLLVPVAYAAVFALLLAPGYAAARAVVLRYGFDRAATLVIAYAVAGVAGYAVFWSYFLKPELGRAVSTAWIVATPFALYALWRARLAREEVVPLALTFATGLFYLAVLYLPGTAMDAAQRFFVFRPMDNVIPQLFAEHLFQGADLLHFLGDWHGSDRPPLQTALLLLVRPALPYLHVGLNAGYEIGGAIAQLVWLPAVRLLCLRAGFSPRQRALVLAFTIFSGFFLYNTVYTWPKLLAAGLCIAALLFATEPARENANRNAGLVLAGVCAALALLAHGSAVFFLLPAFVVALMVRRLPVTRALAFAAAAGVVLLVPWAAYQRYYDPPGDRLLKMHLAGINDVDPRPASAAIAQAYAQTPPGRILDNKLANVQTLVGAAPLLGSAMEREPLSPVNVWRLHEREQVLTALGVLNLGWPVLVWWFVRRPAREEAARRGVATLLLLALVSALFWCAALWGPGATVTTHSAYAVEALLFVALAAAVAVLPIRLAPVLLAAALADLVVTWIVGSLADASLVSPSVDPLMVLFAFAAAAAIGALLVGDARSESLAHPSTSSG
jgi:hypothetical protein